MAAPIIVSRTFNTVVDNRAKLANSNIARLWSSSIGTSWQSIRIGCRLSISDAGADLSSTPRFAFGICSGTSNIFMDATTTHWLGACTGNSTWTRTTVDGVTAYDTNDFSIGRPLNASTRIGSTLTVGTRLDGGTHVYMLDCTTAHRAMLFLDITKGSPNFTLRAFFKNASGSDVDVTSFLTQMELATPSFDGHTFPVGQTIAVDETTNGFFNAVNIAWDRTTPAIEISDVAVVKFS